MDRHEIDRYKSLLRKQHEAKAQELRYERRSEMERLDGSKEIPSNQTGCRSDQGRTSGRLELYCRSEILPL